MLSVTIIALNEEKDLPRCLESVRFADEIIVVDSGSTDRTVAIAEEFGAKVFQKEWTGYGQMKNFAMSKTTNPWVLNIDADEEIAEDLKEEILKILQINPSVYGYAVARKTFFMGQWIRHGGWYPNYVTRLARKDRARWTEPSVHEELIVEGALGRLENPMHHYTFHSIADQVQTNIRYAKQGALELKKRKVGARYLKLICKPVGKFLETYIFKLGILDGLPGFIISVNAAHSMFMKYAFLVESDAKKNSDDR